MVPFDLLSFLCNRSHVHEHVASVFLFLFFFLSRKDF